MIPKIRSKNIYEACMLKKRITEEKRENSRKENTNFYQKSATIAKQENRWTSDSSFNNSIMNYLQPDKETVLERLEQRRNKLRKLISDDEIMYENLRCCSLENRGETNSKCQNLLNRTREYNDSNCVEKSVEFLEKQERVDDRHFEHAHRETESVESLGDQTNGKHNVRDENRLEHFADQEHMESTQGQQATLEKSDRREAQQSKKEYSVKLQLQMANVIKQREDEARELNAIREEIIQEQALLDDLEAERLLLEEKRQRERFGKALLRQHTAALKKRSEQVQEELEGDLAWIAKLESVGKDKKGRDNLKEWLHLEALKARALLEDDLQRERAREADINDLYASEAADMWKKRDEQWKIEQEARHMLLNNILTHQQDQLSAKLAAVRQMQAQKMAEREEMLQDIEAMRGQPPPIPDEVDKNTSQRSVDEYAGAEEHAYEASLRAETSRMRLGHGDSPTTVKPVEADKDVVVAYRGVPLTSHRRKTHLW